MKLAPKNSRIIAHSLFRHIGWVFYEALYVFISLFICAWKTKSNMLEVCRSCHWARKLILHWEWYEIRTQVKKMFFMKCYSAFLLLQFFRVASSLRGMKHLWLDNLMAVTKSTELKGAHNNKKNLINALKLLFVYLHCFSRLFYNLFCFFFVIIRFKSKMFFVTVWFFKFRLWAHVSPTLVHNVQDQDQVPASFGRQAQEGGRCLLVPHRVQSGGTLSFIHSLIGH